MLYGKEHNNSYHTGIDGRTRRIAQIATVIPTRTDLALGDAIALLAAVPALIDITVRDLTVIIPIPTPETLVPF